MSATKKLSESSPRWLRRGGVGAREFAICTTRRVQERCAFRNASQPERFQALAVSGLASQAVFTVQRGWPFTNDLTRGAELEQVRPARASRGAVQPRRQSHVDAANDLRDAAIPCPQPGDDGVTAL